MLQKEVIPINYQKITKFDTANGPGIRVVLWVSGCSHKCPGCHNPQTWDEHSGIQFTDESLKELLNSISPKHIKGITFSGGDPIYESNREEVTKIAKIIKESYPDKSIWLYTGYLFEDIKDLDIIKYLDVLVDGRFIMSKKDLRLTYCGSTNQRVIDIPKTLTSGEIALYDY